MVAVKDADGNKVDVEDVTVNKSTVKIKTAKKLAVTGKYTIEIEGMGSQTAIAGALVRTDAFDKAYAYDGDDLGALPSRRLGPVSRCGLRPPPR